MTWVITLWNDKWRDFPRELDITTSCSHHIFSVLVCEVILMDALHQICQDWELFSLGLWWFFLSMAYSATDLFASCILPFCSELSSLITPTHPWGWISHIWYRYEKAGVPVLYFSLRCPLNPDFSLLLSGCPCIQQPDSSMALLTVFGQSQLHRELHAEEAQASVRQQFLHLDKRHECISMDVCVGESHSGGWLTSRTVSGTRISSTFSAARILGTCLLSVQRSWSSS